MSRVAIVFLVELSSSIGLLVTQWANVSIHHTLEYWIMQTMTWKRERFGDGKYHIRMSSGELLVGMIIGGNGRWFIQLSGNQWPDCYPTINKAAAALVRHRFGI